MLSLILIVVMPIIVLGAAFYRNSVRSQETRMNQRYVLMLDGMAKSLSDTLFTIENDLYTFRTDSVFFNFVRMTAPGDPIDQMRKLGDVLDTFKIKYGMVHSIYFYSPQYECVVTNAQGSFDVQDFYDTSWIDEFNVRGDVKRYNVRRNLNEEDRYTMKGAVDVENVYTIVFRLNKDQLLAVNISVDRLAEDINAYYAIRPGSSVYVYNASGSLMLGDVDQLDELDDTLSYEVGMGYDGWRIVMHVPRAGLVEEFNYFRSYIVYICILILAACVGLSFFLSRIVYRPIDRLMKDVLQFSDRIKDSPPGRNEVEYFKNVFHRINSENELLLGKMSLYDSLTRNALVRDFLQGKIGWEEYAGTAGKIGLAFGQECFKLVILDNPPAMRETIARLNLVEVVHTYLNRIGRGVFMELGTDSFLLMAVSGDQDTLQGIEDNVLRVGRDSFGIGVHAGTCAPVEDLRFCPIAYARCLAAYSFADFFDVSNQAVDEAELAGREHNPPLVPINIEAGLLRSIILRDSAETVRLVGEFMLYLRQHHLAAGARQSSAMLLSALDKEFTFAGRIEKRAYADILSAASAGELERILSNASLGIATYLETSTDKENHYVKRARVFLQENYDRNISVGDVADHLGISYPYLCKLFKDYTDKNILEYLNELRVEHSKSLLVDTAQPISVIAQEIGYNNIQTFQRLFKKQTGVTPGEYRKIHSRTDS